jgi:small subunit ribosomal protein S20
VAHHLSAEKRSRQAIKRAERNRHIKTTTRGAIKRLRESIESGNKEDSAKMLTICIKEIDRAVSKGIYHRKTGSRYISRLSSHVATLQSGAQATE